MPKARSLLTSPSTPATASSSAMSSSPNRIHLSFSHTLYVSASFQLSESHHSFLPSPRVLSFFGVCI
ncbi:hypothetical protein Sjap_008688 [Stephania japonica]|uniref:Uncharacterized protein n=1 Tax=Stephania japonica TaxID=461633 RepID=A0AAP0JQP7_9MAGN